MDLTQRHPIIFLNKIFIVESMILYEMSFFFCCDYHLIFREKFFNSNSKIRENTCDRINNLMMLWICPGIHTKLQRKKNSTSIKDEKIVDNALFVWGIQLVKYKKCKRKTNSRYG